MAKKLSAKQIKYFGTPRQKAALKAKRKAAAKSSHRARTKPNPAKKKKYTKKLSKAKTAKRSAPRKKNSPEIISFLMGNPARKGKKKVAKSSKYKKAASKKNAGTRKTTKHVKKYSKKRNAGGGGALPRPVEWAKLGISGAAGGVLTRVVPQLAGASNTGPMGYAMNIGVMIALTLGAHMMFKDRFLTIGTATGGAIATLLRVVGDQTSYGSTLALSGFGDYMVSNFVTPQRIINPNSAMWEIPNGWGMNPAALPPAGISAQSGADNRSDGNSY